MFELFMYVYSYCNALSAPFFAVGRTLNSYFMIYDYDYNRYGRTIGGCASLGEEDLGPHLILWPGLRPTHLPAKFHPDPSNRLATIHQRCRQNRLTDRQADRQRSDTIGEPFYKRSPKNPTRAEVVSAAKGW